MARRNRAGRQVELGGTLQLPRFNMPFEAGIAYSMHASGRPPHHGVVVLFVQIDTPGVKTLNEIKKLREAARGKVT